jgi:hypothetical protein
LDDFKDNECKEIKSEVNPFASFAAKDDGEFTVEKKRLFHIDMQGPANVSSADSSKRSRYSNFNDVGTAESKE